MLDNPCRNTVPCFIPLELLENQLAWKMSCRISPSGGEWGLHRGWWRTREEREETFSALPLFPIYLCFLICSGNWLSAFIPILTLYKCRPTTALKQFFFFSVIFFYFTVYCFRFDSLSEDHLQMCSKYMKQRRVISTLYFLDTPKKCVCGLWVLFENMKHCNICSFLSITSVPVSPGIKILLRKHLF